MYNTINNENIINNNEDINLKEWKRNKNYCIGNTEGNNCERRMKKHQNDIDGIICRNQNRKECKRRIMKHQNMNKSCHEKR